MQVTILPLGYLRAPFREAELAIEVDPGTTVAVALESLKVRTDLVVAVVINGETADLDTILSQGDKVKLIPVISGGSC